MSHSAHSQFDALSDLYEDMASWPFRKEIETPSVLEALGDVNGLNVLDFGCGDGTYSRILKRLGAARVVGFDEAEGMLAHARRKEREAPLSIDYVNALSPDLDHQFDLVLGVYVLPYASNLSMLHRMCADMGRMLKPGGRLVTLPIHPDFDPDPQYYVPYGFSMAQEPAHADGGSVRLDLFYSDFQATVTAWYWNFSSLDAALKASGFTSIAHIDPMPLKFKGTAYPSLLQRYLERPHAVILDARR